MGLEPLSQRQSCVIKMQKKKVRKRLLILWEDNFVKGNSLLVCIHIYYLTPGLPAAFLLAIDLILLTL